MKPPVMGKGKRKGKSPAEYFRKSNQDPIELALVRDRKGWVMCRMPICCDTLSRPRATFSLAALQVSPVQSSEG